MNFEDLLLFNYHDRDSSFVINTTFVTIRNIEQDKYNIFNLNINKILDEFLSGYHGLQE
jgi:hypothetical protein